MIDADKFFNDLIGHLTYDHCPNCEGLLWKNKKDQAWCLCGYANFDLGELTPKGQTYVYSNCDTCRKKVNYGVWIKGLFVCEECTDQAKAKTDEELFTLLNC